MSRELTPEAFDTLMDTEYPAAQDETAKAGDYFEEQLINRPDLVELKEHIRTKLGQADYFCWRGGDEIEAFVEGFVAAAILLGQE